MVNLKRNRFILGVALAAMTMLGSTAHANNTNTIKVSATITGTCNFAGANNAAGNTTLSFGALDQTATGDANATQTSLNFWCTNGTSVGGISANSGTHSGNCGGSTCMKNTGSANYIPYTLSFTSPTGTGSGKTSPISVNFDASITNSDYVDAPAGTYEDFVTLTISP